jgi:hypothetical protein
MPDNDFVCGSNEWSRVWTALQLLGPRPDVNFETDMILVCTSEESGDVEVRASVNSNGDLSVQPSLRAGESVGPLGLGYRLQQIKRQGITAVNGLPIQSADQRPESDRAPAVVTRNQNPSLLVPAEAGSTTMVYFDSVTLPSPKGNCFKLEARDGLRTNHWHVANMHTENFKRIVSDLGIVTVEILPIGHDCCLIVDGRIPKAWLRDRPCSFCVPRSARGVVWETYADRFRN